MKCRVEDGTSYPKVLEEPKLHYEVTSKKQLPPIFESLAGPPLSKHPYRLELTNPPLTIFLWSVTTHKVPLSLFNNPSASDPPGIA